MTTPPARSSSKEDSYETDPEPVIQDFGGAPGGPATVPTVEEDNPAPGSPPVVKVKSRTKKQNIVDLDGEIQVTHKKPKKKKKPKGELEIFIL